MADYTDPLILQARRLSANTVSTLFNACVLLAIFALKTHEKPDDVMGVGDPSTQTVLSGAKLDPIRMAQLDQDGQYEPLIEDILQSDTKNMTYRDTMPLPSVAGTPPTFTYTVNGNGGIASVTPSGGSNYSGSAPTLQVVNATGSAGYGAILIPTMAGGTITSVAVQNAGFGYASTGVTILVTAGYSEGQKYARPVVRWSQKETVAQIYDNDIQSSNYMVKTADKVGMAMSVTSDAFKRQISNQAEAINSELWTGYPSDQTIPFWNKQFGLLNAIDDGGDASGTGYGGNYCGVDRTQAANYWFRSLVDANSHQNWSLETLVLDFMMTKGLAYKGSGPDLVIVDPLTYSRFRAQATDRTQEVNLGETGALRELGMYGFRKMALMYSGVYCVADYQCPVGTAVCINSKSFKFMFKSGDKFTPSKLYDQHGIPGGIDGSIFYVCTKYRMICEAPALNAKYVNLS